jgi:RNA polymerase sigma-70 factor, ECF subfamily
MTSISGLSSTTAEVAAALAAAHRSDWGRLLSLLVARTRRLDLAEDSLSEAFAKASETWPRSGVPKNPAAWLYLAAHRVVLGRIRHEAVLGRKAPLLAVGRAWTVSADSAELEGLGSIGDERLAMILLACHPAVSPDARSALALRLVIGTATEEIARLFLVPTATMAARITRAKKKIVAAGIPLDRPAGDELRERLQDVCRTIYLAFTAGYTPGTGPDLLRSDLASEAVELARVLHGLVPADATVTALFGLLLLQHARRDARVRDGRLITLDEQDRGFWHHDELERGARLVVSLLPSGGYVEELRLQGLIAMEHARAITPAATDWTTIAALYEALEALTRSPVVRLNRAVAVAESDGPLAGLALLEGIEVFLPTNHRVFAVRGDLAKRAGDIGLARSSLEQALELCANDVERRYLTDRLAHLE